MVTRKENSVAFWRFEYFPAGHKEHAVTPNSEYFPAMQGLHDGDAASNEEYCPATQVLQDDSVVCVG
jgi:hypothetical protein